MEPEEHATVILATGCGCCYIEVLCRCPKAAKCGVCQSMWVKGLYSKFYTRKLRSGDNAEQCILWTLGSSKFDTGHERAALGEAWRKFRMWMDNYSDWRPIFRVVETGKKAGRLHIHFVVTWWLDHEVVLEAWRSAVGEAANVNFSYIPGDGTSKVLGYMLKYLLKDKSKYSWLGSFYKAGEGERKPCVCEHGNRWSFVDDPMEWEPGDEQYYNR